MWCAAGYSPRTAIICDIYINNLTRILPEINGSVICYADDSVILVKAKTWAEVRTLAEKYITMVGLWLDQHLLTLNNSKTHFINFSMYNIKQDEPAKLTIHNYDCFSKEMVDCRCTTEISSIACLKYLGVYIDRNLKYNVHIDYIIKKIRKTIYKFYQLREFMPHALLKIVYQALIESTLNYGIRIWGSACGTILSNLIVTQKYILKIINKKPKRYPSVNLFAESKVLMIRELYLKKILSYMQNNNTYKTVPMSLHNTRSITWEHVCSSRVNFTACQRHISYVGPRVFNLLPLDYKHIRRKKVFVLTTVEWLRRSHDLIVRNLPFLK